MRQLPINSTPFIATEALSMNTELKRNFQHCQIWNLGAYYIYPLKLKFSFEFQLWLSSYIYS